jgi:hypothetical protein
MSLTADELARLARCCAGAAWPQYPGLNRKPLLVRLLRRECPEAAAKVRKMTAREVESLCARLAQRPRPAAVAPLPF